MLPSSKDIPATELLDIGLDHVATILWTIRRGWEWARSQTEARPGTREVRLNVCLRDGMVEALKPKGGKRRAPRMQVSMGNEILSDPSVGMPDGRVDIAISFLAIIEALHDHDPHAIIECKRVAGNDSRLCREYVREGVDRFATGTYGGRHAVGFMAGYLESGTADLAAQGINRYLGRNGRRDELLGAAAPIHANWARSSRHPRRGYTAPLDLHHAFLAFV